MVVTYKAYFNWVHLMLQRNIRPWIQSSWASLHQRGVDRRRQKQACSCAHRSSPSWDRWTPSILLQSRLPRHLCMRPPLMGRCELVFGLNAIRVRLTQHIAVPNIKTHFARLSGGEKPRWDPSRSVNVPPGGRKRWHRPSRSGSREWGWWKLIHEYPPCQL